MRFYRPTLEPGFFRKLAGDGRVDAVEARVYGTPPDEATSAHSALPPPLPHAIRTAHGVSRPWARATRRVQRKVRASRSAGADRMRCDPCGHTARVGSARLAIHADVPTLYGMPDAVEVSVWGGGH